MQADAPSMGNVMDAAIGVTRGRVLNQWAAVEPVRSEMDAILRRNGYRLPMQGQASDLVLRVTPVGWRYQIATQPAGQNRTRVDPRSGSGRLDARVEILDARNPAAGPLFAESYWAEGEASSLGEPEAMTHAARRLAAVFLRDLTPTRVSASVELDDSDDITKPGIELCKDGQFGAAYQAFSDAVQRSPRSAASLYDLAVLAESRGSYDEAESLLLRATAIAGKPLYYTALDRVRNARNDARALAR